MSPIVQIEYGRHRRHRHEGHRLKDKPDKAEIASLEKEIRHHNRRYWDDDAPEISDYDYDRLVVRLKALAPDSAVLNELGPGRLFGAAFQHRSSMLSLDKCYSNEELLDWAGTFEGSVVAMPKFDGIACSLHYDEHGALSVAATRGDGVTGDNITANALNIADIPPKIASTRPVEVRGEIYMRLSIFARYKAEGMANPRNLAAGAIKQKDRKKSASYELSFAAYDLLGADEDSLAGLLGKLVSFGFPKVDYLVLPKDEALLGFERLARARPSLDYEIDGVVFKVDSLKEQRRLGVTGHHPRYALAYKFQGDTGSSTLREVEWSVARTGAITPVAIIEPVALSGVTVTRASLHNVGYIDKLGLTLGARVEVVRRGGVIPNIERVLEEGDAAVIVPAVCPSCGSPTKRVLVVRKKKDGKEDRTEGLQCTDPQHCKAVILGQLAHYADVVGMLGFGDAVLEGAYDAGILRDAADFYALTTDGLAGLERSGEKLGKKLTAEVDKARRLELATFLRALGISDLGKHVSQILADRYRTLDAVLAVDPAELAATHGIGEIIAENVVTGLQESTPLIVRLVKHVEIVAATATGPSEGHLQGKSFVFTGKLVAFARSEAEKRVRSAGGAVLSSVTKQLDYLVVGDDKTGGPSTKQKAADKLISAGAPLRILSEGELMAMLTATE